MWAFAVALLREPALLTGEAERFAAKEPAGEHLDALDRDLRDVARQEGRVADVIALAADGPATEVLVRKLDQLADRRRRPQEERALALHQRAAREAARLGLEELRAHFADLLLLANGLHYDGRRDVLERLGLRVEVYRKDSAHPRYVVKTAPTGDALEAVGWALDLVEPVEAKCGPAGRRVSDGTVFTTARGGEHSMARPVLRWTSDGVTALSADRSSEA